MDDSRFLRQKKLSFIGEQGQARLCSARFSAPLDLDPLGRRVANLYAARAGLEIVEEGPPQETEQTRDAVQTLATVFRHPAARSVGLGAGAALMGALAALELEV